MRVKDETTMMRTSRSLGGGSFLLKFVLAICAILVLVVSPTQAAPRELRLGGKPSTIRQSGIGCTIDFDCDDNNGCTNDQCISNSCVNNTIPNCVPCDPVPNCPAIDMVFIMDTSGSMGDEAVALCDQVKQIVIDLQANGIFVNPTFLGITETPGGPFYCLTDNVVNMLGPTVPGTADTCDFPNSLSSFESWGSATAIVAERFSWSPSATKVIVPISDEGPCNGSFPDGCNDPGDDRDSIANAILTANAQNVVVAPITGTSSDACVVGLATDLADATGGQAYQTQDAQTDIVTAITDLSLDICNDAFSCDDGIVCTVTDTCSPFGQCKGIDLSAVACSTDADCFGSVCNTDTGFCNCIDQPDLCIETVEGLIPGGQCFEVGEEFAVGVELGTSSNYIGGGQFLISYDPSVVEFVSLEPGSATDSSSPFTSAFNVSVDSIAGEIFVAVAVQIGNPGTHGPNTMVSIRFKALKPCNTTDFCFLDQNPKSTILSDVQGSRVDFVPCCAQGVFITDGPLVLSCPTDTAINADAGALSATVNWNPTSVSDPCDGPVTLTCTGVSNTGANFDALANSGGLFPIGSVDFSCTAADACGQSDNCQWNVTVADNHLVEAGVQLSQVKTAVAFERCVEFEFYIDCTRTTLKTNSILRFGPPADFPGFSRGNFFKIPADKYTCVTARDPLHTLTSSTNLTISGRRYVADFTKDPIFNGKWLISGDLDGNNVIDLLDAAILSGQMLSPLNPDTTCSTVGPHADLNGDGIVDVFDSDILNGNLFAIGLGSCCPSSPRTASSDFVTELSIKELRRMGLGELAAADQDGNGFVDLAELQVYPAQVQFPSQKPIDRGNRGSRGFKR